MGPMRTRLLPLALAAASLVSLAACDGEIGTFELSLVTNACDGDGGFELRDDASDLEITISGPGMTTITVTAATSAGTADLGPIPVGKDRVVTVRAYLVGDVVALGASAPFEVKAEGTPEVVVVLRPTNNFAPTADAANVCTKMTAARAGHSASLLPDGRVLLAGGFRELDANGEGVGYLATSEIYDPSSGTFAEGPEMCGSSVCLPRAFAPAVTLTDGRVMLVGGESENENGRFAVGSAAIFDPGQNGWTLSTTMRAQNGRRFHTATLLTRNGHVVVVGGLDTEGNVVTSTEYYDPAEDAFVAGPDLTPSGVAAGRAVHPAGPGSTQAVAVLGGVDADLQPVGTVHYIQRQGEGYELSSTTAQVEAAVFGPGVALIDDFHVIVGGSQQFNETGLRFRNVFASAQYAKLPTPQPDQKGVFTLKTPRIFPCVAPVDDDRALVVGGLDAEAQPLQKAELLAKDGDGVDSGFAGGKTAGTSEMGVARAYATCTKLGDDKILIAGGISAGGQATDSAELYTIKQLGAQ